MTSTTPSHEESFSALAKFLKFLVVPSQKFSMSGDSNNNSFSNTWYECTIISSPRVVDPEMTKIGVDTNETSIFTSCFLSSSSSPSSIQMSTFCPKTRKMIQISETKTTEQIEDSNSNTTVFYAVAIQEAKPGNIVGENKNGFSSIVVTIVLVDEFVKSAATHCDLLFKKELKNRSTTKNSNDNENKEALSLLESLLLVRLFLAPNSYQCWNMKREIFSSFLISPNENNNNLLLDQPKHQLWANEMALNSLMLARVPKSPESWFQRTWLMSKLFSSISSDDETDELPCEDSRLNILSMLCRIVQQESIQFGLKACTVYKRNYPAWEYRRRLWMEVPLTWEQKNPKQNNQNSLLSAVCHISSTSMANCKKLFEYFLLNCELRGTLAFFEKNPSDASAVSFLSNLLLKIIEEIRKKDDEENNINLAHINELVNSFLDDCWLVSQKLIRNCCLVQKMGAATDTSKSLFSLPQLSHEAIWFLRRTVVEASLEKMSGSHVQSLSQLWKTQHRSTNNNSNEGNDVVIHRGWSLSDEIQFVSTIVESHELALRIISDSAQEKNDETVAMIPLNKKDFVSVDQGSFSVIHGLQYLQWLLCR